MAEQSSADFRGTLGRYALFGEIAAGGMATVHLARLLGPVGFARTVAIKRLHPHLAKDPDFVAMFLEEARLAARVRHPNVVATLDVMFEDDELFLVMEYVPGESLSRLVRKSREAGARVPVRHAIGILCAALDGLHAAHEATSERGAPLGIVHRDVSPQNVHVGVDGVARVLDFGIAKATNRVQETRTDQIKGKVAYMSAEQLAKGPIDRRADVYSASVVLWEALTGARLFKSDDLPSLVYSIINDVIVPPSSLVPDLPRGIDAIVMKGLERDPSKRWASTREMAVALEEVLAPSPARDIGAWVQETAGERLAWRMDLVHRIESETSPSMFPPMHADSGAPLEVSGVVSNAPRAVPPEHAEASGSVADDVAIPDDERKTLYLEERRGLFQDERRARDQDASRLPEPSLSDVNAHAERSLLRYGLFAIALLLAGAGLLAFRLVQLHHEADPAPVAAPPPAESAETESGETAIGLDVARTASTPLPTTKPPASRR